MGTSVSNAPHAIGCRARADSDALESASSPTSSLAPFPPPLIPIDIPANALDSDPRGAGGFDVDPTGKSNAAATSLASSGCGRRERL
jgi:hypothetical protein|eukprot:29749-Pelagococcus_subviridis.AAC.3